MGDWYLIAAFIVLLSLALVFIAYSFRQDFNVKWFLFLSLTIIVISLLAYGFWGNWSAWKQYTIAQKQQEKAKQLLASMTPEQVIQKLKARLNLEPSSAKGWFLLGRLYAGQGQWELASEAYKKAYQLDKSSDITTIYYAESLWKMDYKKYSLKIRSLLKEVLDKNPKQGDALAMLAQDAYLRGDDKAAVAYWQRLLRLLPRGSKEAEVIRGMIKK